MNEEDQRQAAVPYIEKVSAGYCSKDKTPCHRKVSFVCLHGSPFDVVHETFIVLSSNIKR